MAFRELSEMDERKRFVERFESGYFEMSELCREFGISRKTGYKWVNRFAAEGEAGLESRSRAPQSCPHRTEERCEQALVALRKKHPHWGPEKLLRLLGDREPDWPWPAASTAGDILKRHGLVEPRRRRHGSPPVPALSAAVAAPNARWAADFKGEFRIGDGTLCYPLTVTDRYSRFLLGCTARKSTATAGAWPVFEALFRLYGLPEELLTDGGTPFCSPHSVRFLSRLAVWWIKLGIRPVRTQPSSPQQNGSHERMHRDLKAATARPPSRTPRAQQGAFDRFRREYNELRPHAGIDLQTPATLYRPSPRPYPKKLEEPTYPGHFEVRRVRANGEIKWQGQHVFLSQVLAGEPVGLEEVDDGLWSIAFGTLLLARWSGREKHIVRL